MSASKKILSPEEIRALRDGDTAVFQKLFFAYQPRLYRFFWLKFRSIEIAEDLAQEVFLRFWQARDRLDPSGNLEIYLFRIAGNLAIDTQRTKHPTTAAEMIENFQMKDQNRVEADVERNQLADMIDKIVATLPDRTRTAFILSRYDELSHKEIAEVMEISVKTVEKHIGKALATLQRELKKLNYVIAQHDNI